MVSFRGKVDTKVYKLCDDLYNVHVIIQFLFDADGKSFDTGYSAIEFVSKNDKLLEIVGTNEEFTSMESSLNKLLDLIYEDN